MKYNIKENGIVVNTIVADLAFVQANFAEYEEVPEAPAPNKTVFTKLEFLELFTPTELEDFLDVDGLAIEFRRPMRVAIKKFDAANTVDVSDERTIALMTGMVASGTITQLRSDEILAGVSE